MDFTYQEKISMMRILLDIVHADGIIDARETFFFNQLKEVQDVAEEDYNIIKEKNSLLALVQIRRMDDEKKLYFSKLMNKMIIIDEDVNVNEVAIYDVVSEFCGIHTNFEDNINKIDQHLK